MPTASSSSGAEIAADSALADAARTLGADPAATALVMDFDGTLSEIVPRPDDARPRPEVVPLLLALVDRFAVVGIVSGRPVEFLRTHLPVPGLALVGQYGLERSVGDDVVADPRVEPFVAAVAAVDKGDAVAALVAPHRVAMFAGDDHGDLSAFDALARLRRDGVLDAVVRVAVRSPEEPAELVARTDVGVAGPAGFVSLLAELAAPDR
jgi:trehalose-6-phosphatase